MTHIDYEMSNEDYHDKKLHPHISSSDVKEVAKTSTLHWALKQARPRKETPAMLKGTCIHALILEPEKDLIATYDGIRRGKDWDKAKAAADKAGKVIVKPDELEEYQSIASAAFETCPDLLKFVQQPNFVAEASVFTECDVTGLPIKVRPDGLLMPKKKGDKAIVLDVKTTVDASPEGFPRQINKYLYSVQAAFYMNTLRCAKIPCERFIFAAVDGDTGITVLHELSELYLKYSENKMYEAMHKLAEAKESGKFDTGWTGVNTVHLPSWLSSDDSHPF